MLYLIHITNKARFRAQGHGNPVCPSTGFPMRVPRECLCLFETIMQRKHSDKICSYIPRVFYLYLHIYIRCHDGLHASSFLISLPPPLSGIIIITVIFIVIIIIIMITPIMLSFSLLLISLLAGTSIASPVSSDYLYNTFGFDEAPSPSPDVTLLDASNQGLGGFFYPTSTGGGGGEGGVVGGEVPDLTVPIHIQQQQQQQPPKLQSLIIDNYYSQQPQPELAEFEIAAEESVPAVEPPKEEPNYASCIKVCCEGHYGEILTFRTGKTGFDYVNRCSLRPSTFFSFFFRNHIIHHNATPPGPPLHPSTPQKNFYSE